MAFRQWRHYVEGSLHPVEVVTDHANLVGFTNVKHLVGRQARWAMTLASYDFKIMHRAGKRNPADTLSRRPDYAAAAAAAVDHLPSLRRKLGLLTAEEVESALATWLQKNPGTTARLDGDPDQDAGRP